MGLRIDEHEIDYGFSKNMEEAISYVGSASNKLNNLYIPTEFVYYKSLINMKARIEEYKNRIKKFEKSILDYIGYVKEAERANQNIIDSLTTGNLWGPMMANNTEKSSAVTGPDLMGTDWNSYMAWVNSHTEKVDVTKLDFYLGSKVSVKSGTKYTEDSMGNGNYGIIGKTDGRPEGEYFVDRAALYYNGHLIANIGDEGTNIEECIKSYAKENNCNENEIKAVMHITTGENHEGATGWVDMSQMSYDKFKENRTKYYQGIPKEEIEEDSKTTPSKMASIVAAAKAQTSKANNKKNSEKGNNDGSKSNNSNNNKSSKTNNSNSNNKSEKEKTDIDISSIVAGIGSFDGNIVYSDDFIGPRAPMEIIQINNKIQNMKNQIGLLEKTSEWLQVEIDEKYGKQLQEIDERIDAKKKALNETYDTLETVDIGTNLKISKELEELYKEKSKITDNEEYKSLMADLAEINYSIEMMKQELPFQKYYAIEENADFQNYKGDSKRIELTNKELWYTGGSGGLYFTEYEKYNPLLIAEQVYTSVGNSTAYGSNGPLYRDVLMAEAGEGAQYLSAYTYMTQEQRNMYNYLFDKKGYKEAEEYLETLKNSNYWQMQRGQYEAQSFLNNLEYEEDENGNKVCTKNSISNILSVFEEGNFQGIEGFQEGLENLFISDASQMTYTQYKQLIIAEYLSENSGVLDKTYDFGQVYGNMVVPRLIGTLIPVPGLSAALVGASATGNAKQQALQGGYDLDKAWTYGIMSGLSEATLEHFLGTIPGVRSTKVASKLAKAGNLGAFCKFGLDIVGEGTEEGLQEYVDAGLRAAILGEEIDLSEVNEQALESFLMGAAMGGVSNVTAPINCVINNQHIQIDKIDTETIESLIEEIKMSQKTTKSNKTSGSNKVTEGSKTSEVSNKITLREKALKTAENLRKSSEKELEKLKTNEKDANIRRKLTEAQEKLRSVEEEYKEKQKNYKPNEKIDITDYQNKLKAIVNEATKEYNESHIETDKRKNRRNKRSESKKESTKNQTKINDIKDDVNVDVVDVKVEEDSTQDVNTYEIAEGVYDIELNVDNDENSEVTDVENNNDDVNLDTIKIENNNDAISSDTTKVEDNNDNVNLDNMGVESNNNDVDSDTTKIDITSDIERIDIENMTDEEFCESIAEVNQSNDISNEECEAIIKSWIDSSNFDLASVSLEGEVKPHESDMTLLESGGILKAESDLTYWVIDKAKERISESNKQSELNELSSLTREEVYKILDTGEADSLSPEAFSVLENIHENLTLEADHIEDVLYNALGIGESSSSGTDYDYRIYINNNLCEDCILFLSEYIKKCIERGIPYNMKGLEHVDVDASNRKDGTVLYINHENFLKHVKVLKEIVAEHPEILKSIGQGLYLGAKIPGLDETRFSFFRGGIYKNTAREGLTTISEIAILKALVQKSPNVKEILRESISEDDIESFINNSDVNFKKSGITNKFKAMDGKLMYYGDTDLREFVNNFEDNNDLKEVALDILNGDAKEKSDFINQVKENIKNVTKMVLWEESDINNIPEEDYFAIGPEFYEKVGNIEEKQNIAEVTETELNQSTKMNAETKEQLNKALDKVEDTNVKTQILKLIDKYMSDYNGQLEYLGTGQSATVFEIGPVVLKFGANRRYENIPLCLDNIYTLEYDPKYNTSFRVMSKLDTEGITEADTQYVYNQLRKNGYVWYDPKPENIGRLPDGGSGMDSLRIIDDVDIESEKEFEKKERRMIDGKISVMERMAKADIDKLKYEINYQKSINPNFDIEKLGSYFKDYGENPWTRDTVDEYVKTYKKKVEIEELNKFIQEIKKTAEVYGESSTDAVFKSLFDKNYGTDQGIFRDQIIRKSIKNEVVKEYNMSRKDAEILMSKLDSIGACSYASASNDIISFFIDKPKQFEDLFGFPLYKKDSDGSYTINCGRLLIDMYIWANSEENGGKLLINENGKIKFSKNAFENRHKIRFSEQNYMMGVGSGRANTDQISRYLKSKSSKVKCKIKYINGTEYKKLNINQMQYVKSRVMKNLKNEGEVSLYIAKGNSKIRFIDTNTGKTFTSTFDWKEGGAHAVKVTEMTDTGFIVSTWGKRCLVPFEDLQNSGAFATYVTEIKLSNFEAKTPELAQYYNLRKKEINALYDKYNVTEAEDTLIEDILMEKINNGTSIYNISLKHDVEEAIKMVKGKTENGK